MASGAYVNTNAETISTSWTVIELSADSVLSNIGPYVDHFEIVGTAASSPTKITYYFGYDAAGDDPASAQVDATLYTTATAGTTMGTGVGMDVRTVVRRSGRTGAFYMYAKTDAGTLSLAAGTGLTISACDSRGGG